MSDWTQVGENLVRHRAGTIYLRAKVEGKVKRVSLGTSDLRIAKIKRDDLLAGMRAAAVLQPNAAHVRTIGDVLAVVAERITTQPQLQPRTILFYRDILKVLKETLPVAVHARSWTAGEAGKWWMRMAKQYHAQRANNLLGVAKRVGKAIVELGLRLDDPTAGLKRMKVTEKDLHIPSKETVEMVIEDVRAQRKAHSEEAGNYIEFLAYAGCRHGQAVALQWEDITKDWIRFKSGVSGTKGADTRRLPISPPLRAILDKMRPENATGPVFKLKTPKVALANACERLQIPHLRVHDLRHFFATWALECGVDVPTVSKWLGHKDGGALVLKTYFHGRDDHGLASAAKLGLSS
ncbi:site-specific integrase [Luteolibacter yonseiensis]|uniref:Site-specific integrase n=1 Tax=Luteolibacter yonseiensis TaxID=1144680 RepID=A0A934VD08_9BACT|nr:site-specific integrase [Luteolibacter yonseiensis]MBK1817536.1 site-specific integrase [Luteolibacter yonseiensis]